MAYIPRHQPPRRAGASGSMASGVVQRHSDYGSAGMADFRYARSPAGQAQPSPRQAALPAQLKSGIEKLSGMAMDGVTVHYNSDKPAQVHAHAYARGGDIHLAAGQEKHLPHEAWHVIQQRQGRVRPTTTAGAMPVNDNRALEQEADVMGSEAAQMASPPAQVPVAQAAAPAAPVAQLVLIDGYDVQPDKKGNNEQILADALDAMIEAHEGDPNDPDSWIGRINAINAELQTSGVTPTVLDDIRTFYQEAAELSFKVNPVLREAWRRSRDSTSNPDNYSRVGGKFKDNFSDLLSEIESDFPNLAAKVQRVPTFKVNKEHMVNKGSKFKGSQTGFHNLMFASAPPTGSKATLSEMHKALHALKPGTGLVDYNAVHPDIRDVIEDEQMDYEDDLMGTFK